MSIATVITEGYGSFGNIPFIILDGYSLGIAPPVIIQAFQPGTKGDKDNDLLWRKDNNFEEQYRNDALAILLMI